MPFTLAIILLTGCSRGTQLEIEAFQVKYLEPHSAVQLIEPYIFSGRESAPGGLSLSGNVITVRETRDNLWKIKSILELYDVKKPSIRLKVDVIEADGADESVTGIADLEELKKLFRFEGYRVAAGGILPVMEGRSVGQAMGSIGGVVYEFRANCGRFLQEDEDWILHTDLNLEWRWGQILHSSVVLREGQTTLIGTGIELEGVKAVILAIRLEIVN